MIHCTLYPSLYTFGDILGFGAWSLPSCKLAILVAWKGLGSLQSPFCVPRVGSEAGILEWIFWWCGLVDCQPSAWCFMTWECNPEDFALAIDWTSATFAVAQLVQDVAARALVLCTEVAADRERLCAAKTQLLGDYSGGIMNLINILSHNNCYWYTRFTTS